MDLEVVLCGTEDDSSLDILEILEKLVCNCEFLLSERESDDALELAVFPFNRLDERVEIFEWIEAAFEAADDAFEERDDDLVLLISFRQVR